MYISLGIDCGVSLLLNKLNLRSCALPFDWVVTFNGITDIINNNFIDYIPTNINKTNKYNVLFLHDNFPDDNDKYDRRITRFKNILETNNEKIIFIRKSHGNYHTHINDIDDINNLDILLKNKYSNLQYEIHIILLCNYCYNINNNYSINSNNIIIHNISNCYIPEDDITIPKCFDELFNKLFYK